MRREPEWSDEDVSLLLAAQLYEDQTCHGCGGWLPETSNAETEGRWEATGPYLCHRCEQIGQQRDAYMTNHPETKNPNRWSATLRR